MSDWFQWVTIVHTLLVIVMPCVLGAALLFVGRQGCKETVGAFLPASLIGLGIWDGLWTASQFAMSRHLVETSEIYMLVRTLLLAVIIITALLRISPAQSRIH